MKYLIHAAFFAAGAFATLMVLYFCRPAENKNPELKTGFSVTRTPLEAHTMSAKFRKDNSYCECTTHANFFEISAKAAKDFRTAVDKIEAALNGQTPSIPAPFAYRCVYGTETYTEPPNTELKYRTVLLVVGLNDDYDEYIYPNSIQQLEGHLPCPILCDKNISRSKIVMGTDPATQNCCK